MKIIASILLIALLSAGCAPVQVQDRNNAEPEYREPPVVQGVLFGVSGEPKNADECFLRYEIIYPEDIRPIELALELETEMKREDGSWLGVSWIEGIREQLPSGDAVFRPGGGGLLHYIHMEELLLACDQMRFCVIVHGCEPGPCPALAIDDRADLFTLRNAGTRVEKRTTPASASAFVDHSDIGTVQGAHQDANQPQPSSRHRLLPAGIRPRPGPGHHHHLPGPAPPVQRAVHRHRQPGVSAVRSPHRRQSDWNDPEPTELAGRGRAVSGRTELRH